MPTTQHVVINPAKLAAGYIGLLEANLVLPNLFKKVGLDDYKGDDDDTVNVKVPGRLPSREYIWRNDRTDEIVFDVYRETKIGVSFGGHVYSGVKITDEQKDFDLISADSLLPVQAKAISHGLQRRCSAEIQSAPFSVVIGGKPASGAYNMRRILIEARNVLNKFELPDEERFLIVGSDFETALLDDDKMALAQNVGDEAAVSALRNAVLGRRYGFTIVVDYTIPVTAAYAMTASAFVLLTAAPSVPQSVPFGATTSFEGLAMRWMRDYETTRFQDRSVVDMWVGTQRVTDKYLVWTPSSETGNNRSLGTETVQTTSAFTRAIKIDLATGLSTAPAVGSDLAIATGVSTATIWKGGAAT